MKYVLKGIATVVVTLGVISILSIILTLLILWVGSIITFICDL